MVSRSRGLESVPALMPRFARSITAPQPVQARRVQRYDQMSAMATLRQIFHNPKRIIWQDMHTSGAASNAERVGHGRSMRPTGVRI